MRHTELELLLAQPSQSLLHMLLDAAPVASSIAVDGRIVYANSACARLWAFDSPMTMLGRSFFDLLDAKSHRAVIELWQARREGSDAWVYDLSGERSDGVTFGFRCTSVSLETERGKATFAFFEEIEG